MAEGCPDADGDRVGDADDACPAEPGSVTNSGCPFPPSIGGIVELAADPEAPAAASGSSARDYAAPLAAALAAGAVALAAGAWYARKHRGCGL